MSNKQISVLIVDDSESITQRMIGLLEEVDTVGSIQTATNYNDAFRMLDNKSFDIVLLDINMPGKNGINLLQKIKELRWKCEVIMVSNMEASYYRTECEKLGALTFLDKTNEFERIPVIISAFAEREFEAA